jgi:uncharacterized protein YoxC
MLIAQAVLAQATSAALPALADGGAWLLAQAAATLPDTIVTKQAPLQPGWFERTQQILDILLTFSFVALAIAVIPAAWNFRQSYKKVSELLDRVYADVNPIAHHASRIAENVDYISTAVRADVQQASATINDANARLQVAIADAETRVREFRALLELVQDEAEATFVSAASTARGVRASAVAFTDVLTPSPRPRRRATGTDVDDADDDTDLLDGDDAPGVPYALGATGALGSFDDLDAYADDEDLDDDTEDDARHAGAERPRVRPRDGRRG